MLEIALNAIPSYGLKSVAHIAIGFLKDNVKEGPELTEKQINLLTLGYTGRLADELSK